MALLSRSTRSWQAKAMLNLNRIEAKAFVPAKDFETSKRLHQDLGFELSRSDDQLACLRHGKSRFLLQNF
jgi:hypothetical protein